MLKIINLHCIGFDVIDEKMNLIYFRTRNLSDITCSHDIHESDPKTDHSRLWSASFLFVSIVEYP